MRVIFDDNLQQTSLRTVRLTEKNLLENLSDTNTNLLQLSMAANTLQLNTFTSLYYGNKEERIKLAEYFLSKTTSLSVLVANIDSKGLTCLHAVSLLLQGISPQKELTPQELRSKRVKTYPSLELKLLDLIFSQEVYMYVLYDFL